MTRNWSERCEAYVRGAMTTDTAHDIGHLRRVVAVAQRIGREERADRTVLTVAAWLHDCVTVPKNHRDRSKASAFAADHAVEWLGQEGFPPEHLDAVHHAIEAHSFSAGIAPRTLEAKVVQDADRLDAIGAIGIARCFATAGAMGSALFDPDDPIPTDRPLDDRRFAVDHFFAKLFRLPEQLHTASAQREGERRVTVMRRFLESLGEEVRVPGQTTLQA